MFTGNIFEFIRYWNKQYCYKNSLSLVKHGFSTAQAAKSPILIIYEHLQYKELEHNSQVLLMFEKGCIATQILD